MPGLGSLAETVRLILTEHEQFEVLIVNYGLHYHNMSAYREDMAILTEKLSRCTPHTAARNKSLPSLEACTCRDWTVTPTVCAPEITLPLKSSQCITCTVCRQVAYGQCIASAP